MLTSDSLPSTYSSPLAGLLPPSHCLTPTLPNPRTTTAVAPPQKPPGINMITYGTIPTSTSPGASTSLEYISHAKQRIKAGLGTRRPWRFMFNFHSLGLPGSFGDAITWIRTNIGYFRMNYAILVLFILFLSLLWHPISLIAFVAMMAARLFLYFLQDEPLVIFGRQIGDRVVMNMVLSVMSYDYPAEKLAVYLSDDGGSDLTFYALLKASKFAQHWLPFCKRFDVEPRSPAAYFASVSSSDSYDAARYSQDRRRLTLPPFPTPIHMMLRDIVKNFNSSSQRLLPSTTIPSTTTTRERRVGVAANMSSRTGVITCKAMVAWGAGQELVMEQVEVSPPNSHELASKSSPLLSAIATSPPGNLRLSFLEYLVTKHPELLRVLEKMLPNSRKGVMCLPFSLENAGLVGIVHRVKVTCVKCLGWKEEE